MAVPGHPHRCSGPGLGRCDFSGEPPERAAGRDRDDGVAHHARSAERHAPTPSQEPTPSPSPTTTTEAPPTPDHNAAIQVLNGTGTQGLAASNTQKLNAAGYAGTSAANATGWDTQVSTVYYEDPRMEATAKDVAATLGIDNVQRMDGIGSPDVVVVLR